MHIRLRCLRLCYDRVFCGLDSRGAALHFDDRGHDNVLPPFREREDGNPPSSSTSSAALGNPPSGSFDVSASFALLFALEFVWSFGGDAHPIQRHSPRVCSLYLPLVPFVPSSLPSFHQRSTPSPPQVLFEGDSASDTTLRLVSLQKLLGQRCVGASTGTSLFIGSFDRHLS